MEWPPDGMYAYYHDAYHNTQVLNSNSKTAKYETPVTMEISINIKFMPKHYISDSFRSIVGCGWRKPVNTSECV